MLFSKQDVLDYLPHREPFLFIDSVEKIDFTDSAYNGEGKLNNATEMVGATVWGNFYVRPELKVLEGHFPGNPILPGVVQIEIMAQTACFLTTCMFEDFRKVQIDVALLTVNDVKFRRPVVPNDELKIFAKLLKSRGRMMSYQTWIECDGKEVSSAVIMASMNHEMREN